MKLLCDKCHKEEEMFLLPNNQVRFECGNTRKLRNGEMRSYFKDMRGKDNV